MKIKSAIFLALAMVSCAATRAPESAHLREAIQESKQNLQNSVTTASAAPTDKYKADTARVIRVTGTVDEGTMGALAQLDKLSSEKPNEPITILVNSPGGSVLFLDFFLDGMHAAQARGTKLVCVVPNLAASAAFTILATCDERVSLTNAKLLFHPVRIYYNGALTSIEAAKIMKELAPTDAALLVTLSQSFFGEVDENSEKFQLLFQHFVAETLFTPAQLNEFIGHEWIKPVKLIEGIPDLYRLD